MPSWFNFAIAAPDLAATVRARLDGHPYKLIATLRSNGAPRVSGIEVEFLEDGGLRAGSMPDSVKVHDLSGASDPDGCDLTQVEPVVARLLTRDGGGCAMPVSLASPAHSAWGAGVLCRQKRPSRSLAITVWTPQHGVRSWTR